MSKSVLAIYYSQSGQLAEMIDQFCVPFEAAGIPVEKVTIRPLTEYPFPWTGERFFSVMPDCVLGVQAALAPFSIERPQYDLIILGYQPWFLSPSIPFNSLMKQPGFREILKGTPVITITGARNMWVNAFDTVRIMLNEAQARLVGNIALCDKHLNLLSIFTIFHWMLSGKKSRWLNFFPLPGVSDEDIQRMSVFGAVAGERLQTNNWDGMQEVLVSKKAVDLKYHLMFMESKAGIMFKLWAKFIAGRKKRTLWLKVFKWYLFLALFALAPIVFLIDLLFFKPFLSKYVRAKKNFYLTLD
jgi:hypothetical protein